MNETTRKTIKAAVITTALSATVFVPVGLAVAGTPQASGVRTIATHRGMRACN